MVSKKKNAVNSLAAGANEGRVVRKKRAPGSKSSSRPVKLIRRRHRSARPNPNPNPAHGPHYGKEYNKAFDLGYNEGFDAGYAKGLEDGMTSPGQPAKNLES
ncbi:hypothetical protein [Paenibacillus sp. y28]|uniref:hypothetical protein n=1 Tax=Paenibacillus sp. y28 TaxID=3129110 RepID=UPI003016834D